MGFFASFWDWLDRAQSTYVGDNTARLASIIEPTVVTLATIYVMTWGYLHLMGKVEEPVIAGLKRIVTIALVFGVGLRLWLYNSVIVDTFYEAPAQLAAAITGTAAPIDIIDSIWSRGGTVAGALANHWNVWPRTIGLLVWCLIGFLCVYAMFLLALSRIALSLLLALGPLFVALALFEATRRLFVAWLAQLTNFAFVTLLTVMSANFLLHLVETLAAQTAARGDDLDVVDTLDMLLASVVTLLILRQVMPLASGLAGGVSHTSFHIVGGSARWAMRLPRRMYEWRKDVRKERTRQQEARALYSALRSSEPGPSGRLRLARLPQLNQ